jgi:hypothetical protein
MCSGAGPHPLVLPPVGNAGLGGLDAGSGGEGAGANRGRATH